MALPSTTTTYTERRSGPSNPPIHAAVVSFSRALGSVRLVTTDEVLTEVLSYFAGLGPYWRANVAVLVHAVRSDPDVDVLPQTRADFDAALALYEARPDKEYSLTDCRSMVATRDHRLTDDLDEATLRAFCTRNDGEPVNWSKIR
jgi:uncharacterized protein